MRAQFVFSEVFTGLRRNVTMTIAMILTTAISLVMFGAGLLVVKAVDLTEERFLSELEVEVFLNDDISQNDKSCNQPTCEALKKALEDHPAVVSLVHINQDEALKKARVLFKNEPEMLDLLQPGALPASLKVKLEDPTRSAAIVQDFKEQPGVDKIHDGGVVVERLVGWLNFFRNVSFIVSIVLLTAALLLIANMIQVSAFTRRTEVGIMRLVGATRWYTQLPFLLEAMFAGLVGAVLAIVSLITLRGLIPDEAATQLGSVITFPTTTYAALVVSPILLLTSMVISAVVGYVTLRLYVRH